ncbi:hypothetical protein BY457_12022 [Marinilabilia salmonicolor]|jgi:hypothetical protein|uniref:hypothetical protein n=1 Tax=Marinilabilia salmonicolor TaxID=989 RepID=UPI000D05B750|nr:hypothetical protein [Marinilabilia salmonicolor]PRY94370.1 hypothetical protein BY457_12022 [Marinilabilia salmonicolor]
MEFDALIFIQAAGDTLYALDLLKKYQGKRVHLCVINIENVYFYLKKISLENVQLDFYPYINFNHKNIISIWKSRNNIKEVFESYFERNKYQEIYFFSRFFDWLTPTLIGKYNEKYPVKVHYLNYNDEYAVRTDKKLYLSSKSFFAHKYFISIVQFITGISFFARYERRTIEFDYKKYGIESREVSYSPRVPIEYQVNFEYIDDRSILFLISPVEFELITSSSVVKLKSFLGELRKDGFNLIVKGHPRLGIPKELINCFDNEIPMEIPVEIINFEKKKFTLGVFSSGLSFLSLYSNGPVFSLIDSLHFKNPQVVSGYKKYLLERSNQKISFPSSFDCLKSLMVPGKV